VINTLGQVAGPFLGGMWVGFAGGPAALWVDALSFLASALLILLAGRFPSPRRQESEGASFWQDMKQGLLYLRTQPIIRSVAIIAPALNFFGNAIGGVLIPVLAVKVWLASSAQYGSLEGSFPLGFAIGAGLIMAFSSLIRRRGLLMFLSLLAGSLLFLVVPLMPTIGAVFPLSIGAGILMAVPNVLFQVLVQSEAPAEMQGRIFGVLSSLFSLSSPVAFLLAGRLADLYSPVLVAVCFAALLFLSILISMAISPELRRYGLPWLLAAPLPKKCRSSVGLNSTAEPTAPGLGNRRYRSGISMRSGSFSRISTKAIKPSRLPESSTVAVYRSSGSPFTGSAPVSFSPTTATPARPAAAVSSRCISAKGSLPSSRVSMAAVEDFNPASRASKSLVAAAFSFRRPISWSIVASSFFSLAAWRSK
jgi:MFS family permease